VRRGLYQGIERPLHVETRAADDLKHLGGRRFSLMSYVQLLLKLSDPARMVCPGN